MNTMNPIFILNRRPAPIEKSVSGRCEFHCDVLKGPDCDGGEEIRKVEDVCLVHWNGTKSTILSLSDFTNSKGLTLEEVLRDKEYDFTNLITQD